MFPGLQTHFDAVIDEPTLLQVRAFGFQWARIGAAQCDVWTMRQMIADAQASGLEPLPIVYDLDRLRGVPAGLDVEWGNEPDFVEEPADYRPKLDEACAVALECGVRLWAPALGNLSKDALRWLEAVRAGAWPPGLFGLSVHRYGDGTFEWAHQGFRNRAEEVAALLALSDGLPYMVTEFGYQTGAGNGLELTEQEQADRVRQEWDFWREQDAYVALLYQINDGAHANEGWGIRRLGSDGWIDPHGWKLAAYTLGGAPVVITEEDGMSATYCVSRRQSFEAPGKPGSFCTYYPKGQTETILCINPEGKRETRPASSAGGAWESWTPSKDGNRAIFYESSEPYALPLVD